MTARAGSVRRWFLCFTLRNCTCSWTNVRVQGGPSPPSIWKCCTVIQPRTSLEYWMKLNFMHELCTFDMKDLLNFFLIDCFVKFSSHFAWSSRSGFTRIWGEGTCYLCLWRDFFSMYIVSRGEFEKWYNSKRSSEIAAQLVLMSVPGKRISSGILPHLLNEFTT